MKQSFHFTRTTSSQTETLLSVMREFYAHEQIAFDDADARAAVNAILTEPGNGFVYLIELDGAIAGYFVVTFCFSLEFHGRYALLDELYVRERYQRLGIGTAALGFIEELARREGIHAVRLEVDWNNKVAQDLYRKAGFSQHDRHLMTKLL